MRKYITVRGMGIDMTNKGTTLTIGRVSTIYMKSFGDDLDLLIKSTYASSSMEREFKPAIGWLHLHKIWFYSLCGFKIIYDNVFYLTMTAPFLCKYDITGSLRLLRNAALPTSSAGVAREGTLSSLGYVSHKPKKKSTIFKRNSKLLPLQGKGTNQIHC